MIIILIPTFQQYHHENIYMDHSDICQGVCTSHTPSWAVAKVNHYIRVNIEVKH